MEIETKQERLSSIVQYLRDNPTPNLRTDPETGQEVHFHEHHHYPAPAPPLPPPKPTVAEKVIPWLYLSLLACIIGTICAFILAVVMVALVIGMLGLAVVAAVVSHLIKTTRESQINSELSHAVTDELRRKRRK